MCVWCLKVLVFFWDKEKNKREKHPSQRENVGFRCQRLHKGNQLIQMNKKIALVSSHVESKNKFVQYATSVKIWECVRVIIDCPEARSSDENTTKSSRNAMWIMVRNKSTWTKETILSQEQTTYLISQHSVRRGGECKAFFCSIEKEMNHLEQNIWVAQNYTRKSLSFIDFQRLIVFLDIKNSSNASQIYKSMYFELIVLSKSTGDFTDAFLLFEAKKITLRAHQSTLLSRWLRIKAKNLNWILFTWSKSTVFFWFWNMYI